MLKDRLNKKITDNPFFNLTEAVYQLLYHSIIDLTLEPGSSLSETALAKQLSVSRTPIRNALMRLQKDGLVIQNKGHSFYVASIRKDDCRQLMEARLTIEGQAAYWSAERASERDLECMEKSLDGYVAACRAWQIPAIVENDHAFHQEIIDASYNQVIVDIYRQIAPRVLHYRHFLFNQTTKEILVPIMATSAKQHQAIFNAIRLGFGTVAKECIERDISGMLNIVSNW